MTPADAGTRDDDAWESALVTRDGKTVAFEILEGRVKLRQVEVSSKNGGVARIKSGLYGGETLVDAPGADLKDGDAVRPKSGSAS